MKAKKEQRGRKPLGENKKERVDLFIPKVTINKHGKPKIQDIAYKAINLELK